jgi:tetratricopeptide (TPR) repeat protein
MAETHSSRILKLIGAATAVISLILGSRQLVNIVSDRAERARQAEASARQAEATAKKAAETVAVARQQAARGEYAEAWRTLDLADEQAPTDATAPARLDVAFRWLEEARKPAGQPFSTITDVVVPTLDRASLDEKHPRRADILAHIGWATFLKRRDTQTGDPTAAYKQALALDPRNPYANVMLAHWLLWKRETVDAARPYFEAALATGKERELVRQFQVAALSNRSDLAADIELIRIADAMRRQNETPEPDSVRVFYRTYRFIYGQNLVDVDPRSIGVAPADQLTTFGWLTRMPGVSSGGGIDDRVVAGLTKAAARGD